MIWDLSNDENNIVLPCSSAAGAVSWASRAELIVGEWTGLTALWNLHTQQRVGSAVADKSIVAAASFSPDSPLLSEVTFVGVLEKASDGEK